MQASRFSFPTRRSSDLTGQLGDLLGGDLAEVGDLLRIVPGVVQHGPFRVGRLRGMEDRKSTRLNSSHVASSYAVFCLKKKNINIEAVTAEVGEVVGASA